MRTTKRIVSTVIYKIDCCIWLMLKSLFVVTNIYMFNLGFWATRFCTDAFGHETIVIYVLSDVGNEMRNPFYSELCAHSSARLF